MTRSGHLNLSSSSVLADTEPVLSTTSSDLRDTENWEWTEASDDNSQLRMKPHFREWSWINVSYETANNKNDHVYKSGVFPIIAPPPSLVVR